MKCTKCGGFVYRENYYYAGSDACMNCGATYKDGLPIRHEATEAEIYEARKNMGGMRDSKSKKVIPKGTRKDYKKHYGYASKEMA